MSPSRGQLIKMPITLEHHGIHFNQISHTYACQLSLTTGMRNHLFWMDISPACYGQLVKMLITLEPHGICELNSAYLGDEGLPSIILAG